MNDEEVWTAVKKTLSDVQMDRPVEAIEQRGRARRRNRGVLGVAAGGGLAAVAALALIVPMASSGSGGSGPDPANGDPVAAGRAPALEPAAFTLAKQPDGSVKLVLDYKKVLDPKALEKALADADVPAVVKAGVLCTPRGEQLPESERVFSTKAVTASDGTTYDLVITPANMPKGSIVYFSIFAVHKGDDYNKGAQYLVAKNAPMNCRSIA